MRLSTPLEFPGSRLVAGWWKQLTPLRPRALWVGHLLLHQVEALIQTSRRVRAEPLAQLFLEALAGNKEPSGVAERLCLGPGLVRGLLRQFQEEGLAARGTNGSWRLSEVGRQALDHGTYARQTVERRTFHFLENEAGQPPRYLSLPRSCGRPWSVDPAWSFDLGVLRACVAQSADWKQQHGFPAEVEAILDWQNMPSHVSAWQPVAVDRPLYLAAALVLAGDAEERVCGFAVDPTTWTLNARETLFQMAAGWPEVFPDLAAEPALEQWREAWLAWCQRRGLPTVEAEDCMVERADQRVRVRAPGRLIERLRSARSEALKGEAWLLAGTGRVRQAAVLELYS